MPRNPRIVVPGVPHHVTQRGNKKADIFINRNDYLYFLQLLSDYSVKANLEIVSYCLMTNHTHLVVVPHDKDSLSRTFKPVHMRYSQRLNYKSSTSGLNWQGRFFSSPMDSAYAFKAIQYTCLNPVRAGLVGEVQDYEWSSASCHLKGIQGPLLTNNNYWQKFAKESVSSILEGKEKADLECFKLISRNTLMNLPLGSDGFIQRLESKFNRNLKFRKRGRPKSRCG